MTHFLPKRLGGLLLTVVLSFTSPSTFAQSSTGLPTGVSPSAVKSMLQSQSIDPASLNALRSQMAGQQSSQTGATGPASGVSATNSTSNTNPADANAGGTATGSESTDTVPKPGSFSYFVMQATGQVIPTFGEELFKRGNAFAALESQPVPADYAIGPGDELILKIFGGAVDLDQRVVVDRSGMILLPKVGPVSVAGIKVRDLEPTLKRQIGKYLSNFSLYAALGSLRGIEIYVVGQARFPGKYTVSSVSTLVNALFATGGPGANGSMRQVELVRNSKVVAALDLYEFISKGDTSKDARLLPGDVINIPPAGPRVALVGNLPKQAIFELAPSPVSTSLGDIVKMAGGLSITTDRLEATLSRSQPGQIRALSAAKLSLDETGLKTPLRDGDVVTLFPIKPAFDNAITLKVLDSPAIRVPIASGNRVSDVIPTQETLLTREFWQRRFALKPNRFDLMSNAGLPTNPNAGPPTNPNAGLPTNPNAGLPTNPNAGPPTNPNAGPPTNPNAGPPTNPNSLPTLGDDFDSKMNAIRSMSKVDQINWELAIIERVRQDDLRTEVISFNLRKALERKTDASNPALLPGDIVTIFSQKSIAVPEQRQTRVVQIEGEINAPGLYELKLGETLPELIARAGGTTANAYIYGTELARESVRAQQKKNLDMVIRRLESGLSSMEVSSVMLSNSAEAAVALQMKLQNRAALQNQIERLKSLNPNGRVALELNPRSQRLPQLTLEDGDVIRVPRAPGSVAAIGSVYSESVLIYRHGRRVNDYLQIAGVSESAEITQTFVVRADGSVAAPNMSSGLLASLNPFAASRDVMDLELMPGDVIVVPEKFNKESTYSVFMRGLKDWTQVLYQMGLAAASIHTLNK
jgi:protein involved in polysaccharide export with SLBB domain